MASIKVRLHFVSEAGPDSRTTVVKVKTIQRLDQPEIFAFPKDKQTNIHHVQLFNNDIVKGVVKSLKSRNKYRKVVVSLNEELQSIYLDSEENMIFNDEYLDEVCETIPSSQSQNIPAEKSIRSKAKDIVLEKFDGENFNANSWLNQYLQECKRVKISKPEYAETLRLFLEKSALEWYKSYLREFSLNNWEPWNNAFLETFAVQSWEEVAYAYNYKYLNGSLMEYALKKRNLLLEVDEDMSVSVQINLIVINLPKTIQDKLEKKNLVNIEDLISKLKQIGHFNEKKEGNSKTEEKKPCGYCEKQGFKNRFHMENQCRLKMKVFKNKNEGIRLVNNAELQNLLSDPDLSKNGQTPHL